jgi:phosphatidylinositol alpha 1,6-mannosyltransferase
VNPTPRVAYFSDSFHEVNGVAHTSRMLTGVARRRGLPFFAVHCGPQTLFRTEDSYWEYELRRGPLSFPVERDLSYDVFFYRYRREIEEKIRLFQPDVIHITGPSDVCTLGLLIARSLKIPIVASWHTNLHEYAGRRLEKMLPFLPKGVRSAAGQTAQNRAMDVLVFFYNAAEVLLAPNRELIDLLREHTGKPGFLMRRGVDTNLFTPEKRTRTGGPVTLGYVGRLSVEKNIHFLTELESELLASGITNFRFLIVGDGIERERLQSSLRHAEFTSILRGEDLARAYADMDVFIFPSHTDTFGNVVLEALASAVPAVVTSGGGPKFIVRSGETGYVAADDRSFIRWTRELIRDADTRGAMGRAARRYALENSWEAILDEIYVAYEAALQRAPQRLSNGAMKAITSSH